MDSSRSFPRWSEGLGGPPSEEILGTAGQTHLEQACRGCAVLGGDQELVDVKGKGEVT